MMKLMLKLFLCSAQDRLYDTLLPKSIKDDFSSVDR